MRFLRRGCERNLLVVFVLWLSDMGRGWGAGSKKLNVHS